MTEKIRTSLSQYHDQMIQSIHLGDIIKQTNKVAWEGSPFETVHYWIVSEISSEVIRTNFVRGVDPPFPEITLIPFRTQPINAPEPWKRKILKLWKGDRLPILVWPTSDSRSRRFSSNLFLKVMKEEISTFCKTKNLRIFLHEIKSPKISNVFKNIHVNKYSDLAFDLLLRGKRKGFHYLWKDLSFLLEGGNIGSGFNISTYLELM